jgi:6,7-dimethyl-8-ribityllumazine synthase
VEDLWRVGRELHGQRDAAGCRFAVIVSHFNEEITAGLLQGARAVLEEASVSGDDITVVHVPGAFELPVAALRAAESGRFDAVICLGCLIKGETMHFEYIAAATAHGIMDASQATGIPMAFGVLTTLTDEQAMDRSGEGPDNKGREAALAAVQMATLFRHMDGDAA